MLGTNMPIKSHAMKLTQNSAVSTSTLSQRVLRSNFCNVLIKQLHMKELLCDFQLSTLKLAYENSFSTVACI